MYYYFIYIVCVYFLRNTALGNSDATATWKNEENCGTTMYDNDSVEIGKGEKYTDKPGLAPWLARLGVVNIDTQEPFFHCEGSLISRQIVISSAHCGTANQVARLGENNIDENVDCKVSVCPPPPQDIKIRTQVLGNNHCNKTNRYDILVIGLETPVEYNDFVRPICVSGAALPMKGRMIISGFSVSHMETRDDKKNVFESEKKLTYAEARILEKQKCDAVYAQELDEGQLCVGYSKGVKEPCAGSPGGALIVYQKEKGVKRAYLMGVAYYDLETCESGGIRPVSYSILGVLGGIAIIVTIVAGTLVIINGIKKLFSG
ncbi:anionic trypsin-1-like [Anoplophora glabripennis]|uniref:anionic trypsin-1-like n=1 Tax=Anoplophora glabripennis TaxID=217634 RepID=UPI0008757855|nr:anionic trypsin-1-like [Anoplophora glabripennis]